VTDDYAYNSAGFDKGFSIQLLKVKEFDKGGKPKIFDSDSLRADLNYSSDGKIKNKLWFYKDNENYYWTYDLRERYKTLPLKFEKGKWYLLWSSTFNSGLANANSHRFFIHIDSIGKFNVFEIIQQLNL